jgi:hypothetical protein
MSGPTAADEIRARKTIWAIIPMTDEVMRFEIAKLSLEKGDTLVVKVDQILSREQVAHVHDLFMALSLPENVKVLVLTGGMPYSDCYTQENVDILESENRKLKAEAAHWKERHDIVLQKHIECCGVAYAPPITDEMVMAGAKAMVLLGRDNRVKGAELPTRLEEARACLEAAYSVSREKEALRARLSQDELDELEARDMTNEQRRKFWEWRRRYPQVSTGKGVHLMKLFYHPAGPLVTYREGMLLISDLNPEVSTKWRMSRAEMLGFAWRCLVAACRG